MGLDRLSHFGPVVPGSGIGDGLGEAHVGDVDHLKDLGDGCWGDNKFGALQNK